MANGFLSNLFDGPVEAGTGNQAMSGFEQLLGNPLFTGGIGLLAGSLDDRTGPGEDILGALSLASQTANARQEREAQRLQNEAARQELLQRTRQQRARQEIFQRASPAQPGQGQGFGILEASGNISPDEEFGLFAEAFPEEAGALVAERFAGEEQGDPLVPLGNGMQVNFSELTPNMQEAVANNLVPGTPEFEDFIQQARSGGAVTDADRIQAEAAALMASIEARRESRDEQAREFNTERAISGTLRNLRELRQINDRLRGTVGETGLGFDNVRQAAAQGLAALKSLTGFGDQRARDVLNDVRRFEQLSLTENVGNIGTLKENLGGRVTQFEFEKFLETGPSPSNPADVNNQIILDQFREFKRLAEFQGVDVPRYVDEEIERLERDLSTEGAATVGDVEVTPSAGDTAPRSRQRGNTQDLGDGFTLEFLD